MRQKVSVSMSSVLRRLSVSRRTGLVSACVALVAVAQLVGAGKSPIKVLKVDPTAAKVGLFEGMESGALAVRVVAHDVKGGNVFIENLSDKPLTVEFPDAVAMVHVLKQAGGNGLFGQGNGGLQQGQQGGQQGGGQSIGAGMGQQQGNTPGGIGQGQGPGQGQNFFGNGIFSIPAERVAQVPYQSVCLNYGKPDPSPRMTYKPVPLEEFTRDKVLQETLRMFGKGRLDHTAAQAAAWHLTDKMSWNQLASLKEYTLPGVYTSQVRTFSDGQLHAAQELVNEAGKKVAAAEKANPAPKTASTGRVREVSDVVRTK